MTGEVAARKISFLPGPVVSIALFLLKRNLVPWDLILLILVYGFFLALFWVAPWRHRTWKSSGDERTEAFRKLVLRIRHALVTAMIVVPLLVVIHFICIVNLASWVDSLLIRGSTIMDAGTRTDLIPVPLGFSTPPKTSYIIAMADPSHPPRFYAMPTPAALNVVSIQLVHALHPAAWAILLLAVVFVVGLRIAELLGEGAFNLGSVSARVDQA